MCIVLDAPNLCMNLGKHKEFKCEALKIALDYWKDRGFEKVFFLPQNCSLAILRKRYQYQQCSNTYK